MATREESRTRECIGEVDDFDLNAFKIIDFNGTSVGVVRTDSGFYALRNHCPHQGAPLCLGKVTGTMLPAGPDEYQYGLENEVVRCLAHGYEFHLATGRSAFGVVSSRVRTYKVEVDGENKVWIHQSRAER